MNSFSSKLKKGIIFRLKNTFYRPFSTFDIGWLKEKILKHQSDNKLKYHVYKNKYRIAFRDSNTFLVSVKEIFIDQFYKFKSEKSNPKIIDCGSYIGTSILFLKDNYPNASIRGFEPDKENYLLLKENITSWNLPDTTITNAAIWINNDSITFKPAGNMSSKIEKSPNEKIDNQDIVNCVRLNDLLDEEIDFLKIDIEGAEYEVLKDCAANLKNVTNLFVEYHSKYAELFKLNEILDILLKNDFKYYIKEGSAIYKRPLFEKNENNEYDVLLNIFAFRV